MFGWTQGSPWAGAGCRKLTRSLYRVNFEVTLLEPFPHLAFPRPKVQETARELPGFDGGLMAALPPLAPKPFPAEARTLLQGNWDNFRLAATRPEPDGGAPQMPVVDCAYVCQEEN